MTRSLKEELKVYAEEIGIAALGVADPEALADQEGLNVYRERVRRSFLTGGDKPRAGFEPADFNRRIDPRRILRDVKSIIVVAVPYKVDFSQKDVPFLAGRVARVGWGRDYHLVVSEKLRKIEQYFRDALGDIKAVSMVDSGPLFERAFAVRAGVGWIGKNNTLIVPKVGSYVYLGEILLDRKIEPDQPLDRGCGSCTKCIEACPTGALVEPWMLNTRVCISYLTQVSEVAPEWIVPLLGGNIYGCDICQDACPFNARAPYAGDPEFCPRYLLPQPDLRELMEMDARVFIEKIGSTAAEWVGREVLQKNALVALIRYSNAEVSGLLEKAEQDSRPLIRSTARWVKNYILNRG